MLWLVRFGKVGHNSGICITILIWIINTVLEEIFQLSPLTYACSVCPNNIPFTRKLVYKFLSSAAGAKCSSVSTGDIQV